MSGRLHRRRWKSALGGFPPPPMQPPKTWSIMEKRKKAIYEAEAELPVRQSHKNPAIQKIYETYLGEPCGELSHKLLHTEYCNRQDLLQ